eukprot:TRINITY_DN43268_c0_g1_i1.p1 TRINITY_DN43268_c0_g1~~TRINITY_DN43268_c0_g1_i1.p1  ORF type:complete len:615 (+),score=100.29 TRINITY_DN43268_c0_g1_i1:48-1892(+)
MLDSESVFTSSSSSSPTASEDDEEANGDDAETLCIFRLLGTFFDSHAGCISVCLVMASCLSSGACIPHQGFAVTARIVLVLLDISFMFAFISAWRQAFGLIGKQGVVPLHPNTLTNLAALQHEAVARGGCCRAFVLRCVTGILGCRCVQQAPGTCIAGPGLAAGAVLMPLLLMAPFRPAAWLAALQSGLFAVQVTQYKIFIIAGANFTTLQWDYLLNEAGIWAVPLTLAQMAGADMAGVATLAVFRLLALKLMWLSGLCKLATRDPIWASGQAMEWHFLTQPLPSPCGAFAHAIMRHCPCLSRALSVGSIVVELAAPLLTLVSFWWARAAGFALLSGLLLSIAITGNYGFFHLLSLAVSVSLLGDDLIMFTVLSAPSSKADAATAQFDGLLQPLAPFYQIALLRVFVISCVLLACLYSVATAEVLIEGWRHYKCNCTGVKDWFQAIGACEGYGLFGAMTTERNEVVIFEQHRDCDREEPAEWFELAFVYKPGPLNRRPPMIPTLHMPRLDWMLWFTALRAGSEKSLQLQRENGLRPLDAVQPWFLDFLQKLESREKAVVDLLARDTEQKRIMAQRPLQTRVALYKYDFTWTRLTHQIDSDIGRWWTRHHILDIK